MSSASRPFLRGAIAGALFAMAAGIAALCWTFRDGLSARAAPSRMESRIASRVFLMSMPNQIRAMRNHMANSPEDLQEGMEHYADHCAVCHANNGGGDTMLGRGLSPPPPDLRLAATQRKSDGELYYIIENGVRMTGMPAFGEAGGEHEHHGSWDLVFFIRHLPDLNPEEELQMRSMNPVTPSEMRERQAEDDFLNRGDAPNKKGKTR